MCSGRLKPAVVAPVVERMLRDQGSAPSWLYSFVDLAFLLVIALSLMKLHVPDTPALGELEVPRVHAATPLYPPDAPAERWQLRVHPPEGDGTAPFELAHVGAASFELAHVGAAPSLAPRLEIEELRAQLEQLRSEGTRKPLLAPHENSLSKDLLEAVGLLELLWPSRRPVLVAREPVHE